MLSIYLSLFVISKTAAAPCFCSTYTSTLDSCLQCEAGYYLIYGRCQLVCPTGFAISLLECLQVGQSLMIIGTNFYETSKIFTNTVGDFVTTTNDFSDINTNLIPTKDRGFYSHSTSNLKSKSTISIAPHFTIKFYIKPIANGILLTLENLFSIGYQVLLI